MKASGPAPVRLLLGSFLALIAIGTGLLLLPAATPPGRPIGVVDALFTATSATCVTGLVVRDTGSDFTRFGQLVILGLIQLGGLGVMTFSLLLFVALGGRLPRGFRSVLQQTVTTGSPLTELLRLLRPVLGFTLAAELLGAMLLFAAWHGPLGGGAETLYAAVFHAISAFCNAGFGLWSDSLMRFRGDVVTNVAVTGLVIGGGLGYLTVHELLERRTDVRRLSLHSKLVLTVTVTLLAAGTAGFWLLEADNALAGLDRQDTLLAAWFQSVTPRTAGFNTVDIAALEPATLFLLVLLMFVGGSPNSTAGGIKTTTLGVLALAAASRLRGHSNVNAFRRTIPRPNVQSTLAVAGAGVAVVATGLFALLALQGPAAGSATFLDYLFETVSALGTVGLSTGATTELTPASRLLVSLLMLLGRVGPLSAAAALARARALDDWRYPLEEVRVG